MNRLLAIGFIDEHRTRLFALGRRTEKTFQLIAPRAALLPSHQRLSLAQLAAPTDLDEILAVNVLLRTVRLPGPGNPADALPRIYVYGLHAGGQRVVEGPAGMEFVFEQRALPAANRLAIVCPRPNGQTEVFVGSPWERDDVLFALAGSSGDPTEEIASRLGSFDGPVVVDLEPTGVLQGVSFAHAFLRDAAVSGALIGGRP